MCERPSIAIMIGGRPGCVNSVQSAVKTGHEASGSLIPSCTSWARVALGGRAEGNEGFVVTFVDLKKASLALRVWESRVEV